MYTIRTKEGTPICKGLSLEEACLLISAMNVDEEWVVWREA